MRVTGMTKIPTALKQATGLRDFHHWIGSPVQGYGFTCSKCGVMGNPCRRCAGNGLEPVDDLALCSDCGGDGIVPHSWESFFNREPGELVEITL